MVLAYVTSQQRQPLLSKANGASFKVAVFPRATSLQSYTFSLRARSIKSAKLAMDVDPLPLQELLRPLPPECLGMLTLGYHLTDGPGRVMLIRELLAGGVLPRESIPADFVLEAVLQKVLRERPELLTSRRQAFASVAPLHHGGAWLACNAPEWAPVQRQRCDCGAVLRRWRQQESLFVTMGRGLRRGYIVFSRCESCAAVFGGHWKWSSVPSSSRFPDGFHTPTLASHDVSRCRWIFAVPGVCWEVVLLDYLIGLMARSGATLSSLFAVYDSMWSPTLLGSHLATRAHFVNRLTVAAIVRGCLQLFHTSCLWPPRVFQWHLRSHHIADDFEPLLHHARAAFSSIAAGHNCETFAAVPALVVDGKWCIQTPVCNERASNPCWSGNLGIGYFQGCKARPAPGAFFCRQHLQDCTLDSSEEAATSHREMHGHSGMHIEYYYQESWRPAADVPVAAIRSYELSLLHRKPRSKAESPGSVIVSDGCNKDDRKGALETACGRKTAGVLAAVSPCLQIMAIRPMFASESMTQIDFLVCDLLVLFPTLTFMLYDNACGMRRHLRHRAVAAASDILQHSAWQRLLQLRWVVDRLHWCYHRACRNPEHSHYDPDVSPHAHPLLQGIDTEAAEQIFHIANRWQIILSSTAPVHQELFMLLFAFEHNRNHSCAGAASRRITATSAVPSAAELASEVSLPTVPGADASCDLPPRQPRRRARLGTPACEPLGCDGSAPAAADVPTAAVVAASANSARVLSSAQPPPEGTIPPLPVMTAADRRRLRLGDLCVVNFRSMKAHSLLCSSSTTAACGWWFGAGADRCRTSGLQAPGLSYCGTCCGSSEPVDTD